jgi:putative membrane protein
MLLNKRLLILPAILPCQAAAHVGEPLEPHDLFTAQAWVLDPWIVLPLLLAALLYWRGHNPAHGIRRWEARCYWSGWAILAIALVSPVHAMGEVLFSAHMTQHELMMVAAAPLLVLGRPLVPYIWAFPERWRKSLARPFLSSGVQRVWRFASRPLQAWSLHGLALWVWHVPALYQATVSSNVVHSFQHLSFLLSALLFWWSLLRNPRTQGQYGLAAVYVFGTALHSSILGALLTFANAVWYPVYSETTWSWGLTALEDQQLGGVIMWVPAGVLYTIAGLALMAAWLRESETRVRTREVSRPWL